MDQIIDQMVKQYSTQTVYEKKNSIKEVVQEIVLCGLSRAGFFKTAAFYGGTALRIFYGLDRFSEDLDFSLKAPDHLFDFADFLPPFDKEIRSYGLNFRLQAKDKVADSDIKSAFLKGNTREHLLMFFADEQIVRSIGSDELIKVKLEVDTNPPDHATFETKYRLLPFPYEIMLYDLPSLFAGKIHAVIGRAWKNRVKGRDLYDYVFYLSRATAVNMKHLAARLEQSGYIPTQEQITIEDVKKMLRKRFEDIDYAQAKQDILPFIKNPGALDVWKSEFFNEITEGLKADA
jgi:predicted nucleotidyltransferase component of viral defense system